MSTAKIFTTGRSQAVRLPKEFRFKGDEVCIKRIGSVVVMFEPAERMDMLTGSFGQVTKDFMLDRQQPRTPDKRRSL